MQIIEKILMIDGPSAQIVDAYGKSSDPLEIVVGVRTELHFDLRTKEPDEESGSLLPVDFAEYDADAFYIAMDADYDQETIPKLLRSDGLKLEKTAAGLVKLRVDVPNTAIPSLLAALKNAGSISFHCEIGGLEIVEGEPIAGFVIQFEATVRNRVYIPGMTEVPPEVTENPDYLTKEQVEALLSDLTKPDPGPQGAPGKSAYEIAKEGGYQGTQEEWLESLKGADGAPGKSAYEIAKEGGYEGTEQEWLESLKGAAGLSAYEIACLYGFNGTEEAWLASLKGAPGDGLYFDVSGDLNERDLYAEKPAGFVFAGAVTDEEAHTSELWLYKKKSDDYDDWYDPLVLKFFEKEYKLGAMEPVRFKKPDPEKDYDYLTFSTSDYPYATIAAVTIDTTEGELTLPYDSAKGVRKIIRNADQKFFIYFGTQVPTYETGRIYLTQFLGVEGELISGGTQPGGGSGGGSGGQQQYEGRMYYGYIPPETLGTVHKITEVTLEMLQSASGHVQEADSGTLDLTSLGEVPAGAMVIVAIPVKNPLRAEKFNGLGGYTTFITDNVEAGTGANKTTLTLNEEQYKVWGEYVLAAAEISIRITAQE